MNEKYYYCPVNIILERDSDLFRQIERLAKSRRSTFDEAVEAVVSAGVWNHMKANLQAVEEYVNRENE